MARPQLGQGDSGLPIESDIVFVNLRWFGVEDLVRLITRDGLPNNIGVNSVLDFSDVPYWDCAVGLRIWADVLKDLRPQGLLHPSPPLGACHPLVGRMAR